MDLQFSLHLSLVYWCAKQAQSSNFSGSVPCCFDLGTLEQHVRCLSPSGLLLSCSCSTSLDSAFFLQRRAALPVIETQKSPWSVSDVDRRETGLFPGKTKTSLSGSYIFFFVSLFTWVKQLLRGMRLSFKKPAKCVKELHSPKQQHANTHWLFIMLCWLMDKHAASADRVVNIDETSCRPLPVHQTRDVKQAQLWGNAKEATTFTVAFSMDRGPAGHADRASGQDRLGHHGDHDPAVHSHIGQNAEPEQRRRSLDPSLGHGQHPRQRGHDDRHDGIPSRRTVLPPATKRVPGLDNWLASIACPQRCPPQRSRRRGHGTPFPRRALRQAHRAGARSRRPRGLGHGRGVRRRGRRAMPDAPPEPEMIDMPPAPVSARPMSNLERCITLRLVATRRSHRPKKYCPCIMSHRPSVVSRVRCPVCRVSLLSCPLVSCPGSQTVTRRFPFVFFFLDGLKKC